MRNNRAILSTEDGFDDHQCVSMSALIDFVADLRKCVHIAVSLSCPPAPGMRSGAEMETENT